MNTTRIASFSRLALLGLSLSFFTTAGHVQAQDRSKPVHCGVDRDHRAHSFHSKQHHEHWCPGGPHRPARVPSRTPEGGSRHCQTDYDHRPHEYTSGGHHHHCPGGPHR